MRLQEAARSLSHSAFADESRYNTGRYRAIALITLEQENVVDSSQALRSILDDSDVSEFKWKKLGGARERFAALAMLDLAIQGCLEGRLRVDALTWDRDDSRHKLKGRDDIANLQRMYYHLFKNVLRQRWPDGAVWRLCPDRHTAIDWDDVKDFLSSAGTRLEPARSLFDPTGFGLRLRQEFNIERIEPLDSRQEPLIQLADLFAGLAAYSRNSYDRYEAWQSELGAQLPLLERDASDHVQLSRSDRERCPVLATLDRRCKGHTLGVSLQRRRGLKTFDPTNPINFWWYEPQHEADKAPVRSGR